MELWKLITWLEGQDQSMHVRNGFGMPSSYRGHYRDVVFEPADETTICQMLEYARSALGATFDGYKGGRYRMDKFTTCWIAPYGQTVDAPITEAALEMMVVSSEIAKLRADLARVTEELDEAIEDRRQARDDAARAAALLAVRTMERDARPEITAEDAAALRVGNAVLAALPDMSARTILAYRWRIAEAVRDAIATKAEAKP